MIMRNRNEKIKKEQQRASRTVGSFRVEWRPKILRSRLCPRADVIPKRRRRRRVSPVGYVAHWALCTKMLFISFNNRLVFEFFVFLTVSMNLQRILHWYSRNGLRNGLWLVQRSIRTSNVFIFLTTWWPIVESKKRKVRRRDPHTSHLFRLLTSHGRGERLTATTTTTMTTAADD